MNLMLWQDISERSPLINSLLIAMHVRMRKEIGGEKFWNKRRLYVISKYVNIYAHSFFLLLSAQH